jgi:hypothetical protein
LIFLACAFSLNKLSNEIHRSVTKLYFDTFTKSLYFPSQLDCVASLPVGVAAGAAIVPRLAERSLNGTMVIAIIPLRGSYGAGL